MKSGVYYERDLDYIFIIKVKNDIIFFDKDDYSFNIDKSLFLVSAINLNDYIYLGPYENDSSN